MRFGGLDLLRPDRRNGRLTPSITLASWHSPHSLTWRFILKARLAESFWPRFGYHNSSVGPHRFLTAGFFPLLGINASRDNNGWQWGVCFLGLWLDWLQQRPMWFRDLYRRRENEKYQSRAA